MSSERIRLFVAATVPDDRLREVADLVAPLRAKLTKARWTDVDNQHLTLKFLGSTPVDLLDPVKQVVARVAGSHAGSQMRMTDLGAFPSRTRIRVLWVGVEDPAHLLSRAAADLDRSFEPLGFPSEGRPYAPHLTLARFKIPVPLKSGFPSIDTSTVAAFAVEDLVLFRSHLSPKGARYEVLERFPLGG